MVHYNRNQIPLCTTVKHIHVLKMILETKLVFQLHGTFVHCTWQTVLFSRKWNLLSIMMNVL